MLNVVTSRLHSQMAMARQQDSAVMLSTFATLSVNSAKHLEALHDRPFAAAQGDSVRHLRLLRIGRRKRPYTNGDRCNGYSGQGDASVPTQLHTPPAPTRYMRRRRCMRCTRHGSITPIFGGRMLSLLIHGCGIIGGVDKYNKVIGKHTANGYVCVRRPTQPSVI